MPKCLVYALVIGDFERGGSALFWPLSVMICGSSRVLVEFLTTHRR
jgi:hypothetical protein